MIRVSGRRPRRSALAIVGLAAISAGLVLTGCAGSTAPVATATPRATDSPLEQYLVPLYGSGDQAETDQKWQQVEYLTAACMADQGFDYTPEETGSLTTADQWHPDDPSWVARWGYGVIEYPDSNGRTAYAQPLANQSYVASLQGAEYGEYYEALYGDEDDWASGCYGSSVIDQFGRMVTMDAANAPIMKEIDDFQASLSTNPDLRQIDAEWSECMAGLGYEGFSRQQDAPQSMYSLVGLGSGFDPDDTQRRDELHEQEVDLALADLECRQQVDYAQRHYRVQFALEQEFIDIHKAELDAIIAEAVAARAEADAG